MSNKNQSLENYEVIQQIGKGSFGIVCKIKRKSDNKILVWKELNYGKMSDREKQQLVAEVNIIRELKHANIVRYYDRVIDKKETKIYIIMEYCEGGDMGALLKKCKKDKDYIAEDVIWKIFTQIVSALNECHQRKQGKILHRDLKPANIFLDSQNNIKLGDFGLSKLMSDQSVYAQTHVGTPYYMSPEQINESKYNEKSDIWSAGCLLYEMAALRPPFEATNHLSLAIKIKAGKYERLPMRYSEELQKTVQAMISIDQNARPNVEDLMQFPQISLRLKERQLRERHQNVKVKEAELKEKEQALKERENQIKKKMEDLSILEQQMKEVEERNKQLEKDLFNKQENEKISNQIEKEQRQFFKQLSKENSAKNQMKKSNSHEKVDSFCNVFFSDVHNNTNSSNIKTNRILNGCQIQNTQNTFENNNNNIKKNNRKDIESMLQNCADITDINRSIQTLTNEEDNGQQIEKSYGNAGSSNNNNNGNCSSSNAQYCNTSQRSTKDTSYQVSQKNNQSNIFRSHTITPDNSDVRLQSKAYVKQTQINLSSQQNNNSMQTSLKKNSNNNYLNLNQNNQPYDESSTVNKKNRYSFMEQSPASGATTVANGNFDRVGNTIVGGFNSTIHSGILQIDSDELRKRGEDATNTSKNEDFTGFSVENSKKKQFFNPYQQYKQYNSAPFNNNNQNQSVSPYKSNQSASQTADNFYHHPPTHNNNKNIGIAQQQKQSHNQRTERSRSNQGRAKLNNENDVQDVRKSGQLKERLYGNPSAHIQNESNVNSNNNNKHAQSVNTSFNKNINSNNGNTLTNVNRLLQKKIMQQQQLQMLQKQNQSNTNSNKTQVGTSNSKYLNKENCFNEANLIKNHTVDVYTHNKKPQNGENSGNHDLYFNEQGDYDYEDDEQNRDQKKTSNQKIDQTQCQNNSNNKIKQASMKLKKLKQNCYNRSSSLIKQHSNSNLHNNHDEKQRNVFINRIINNNNNYGSNNNTSFNNVKNNSNNYGTIRTSVNKNPIAYKQYQQIQQY